MKVSGGMICRMDGALRVGMMGVSMRESIKKE